MKFSSRVRKISVSAIKQIPLLARAYPDTISLGQGIPSVPTPRPIAEAVAEALLRDPQIGKYTLQPGMPALKEAVAQRLSIQTGRNVDPESEVFISGGAMEALFAAIVSLIDDGDEVILFDPSYASHIELVLFAGGAPVFVPLEEGSGWGLNPDLLRKAITQRTKAIIVCNPCNPTGKVFSRSELADIGEIALEHDITLIADETYDFLVYENNGFVSLTSFPELASRVVACYSFSKQFAMIGWRVGFLYAPAEVVAQALKVHDAVLISAPTVSQYAALTALRHPQCGDEVRSALTERRAVLCSRLRSLSDLFAFHEPKGAYYVFARFLKTSLAAQDFCMKLLREAHVIALPGHAFGPSRQRFIRFSFGVTPEELHAAVDRLENWNRNLQE